MYISLSLFNYLQLFFYPLFSFQSSTIFPHFLLLMIFVSISLIKTDEQIQLLSFIYNPRESVSVRLCLSFCYYSYPVLGPDSKHSICALNIRLFYILNFPRIVLVYRCISVVNYHWSDYIYMRFNERKCHYFFSGYFFSGSNWKLFHCIEEESVKKLSALGVRYTVCR